MIIPELPSYLESIGGGEYKGLIIAVFTVSAGLSRPFSGKLADTVGRIPVMIFGVVICFIVGFLYPVTSTIIGFLIIRFIHGFSTGFKPTGTAAYVADVVPSSRRGEAMGILGISGSLGMAAGPAAGGFIAINFTLETLFYASSIVAMLSILVLIGIKETVSHPQKFRLSLLRISPSEVIEPKVLAPSLVMMFTAFPFGVILTLIPDFSDFVGLANRGTFFAVLTIASVLTRYFAGKASDKYGRVLILKISTLFIAISLVFVGLSNSVVMFLVSAFITGIAVGMNSPTIFAWVADLSDPSHKAKAMSTMFIALEIGIGTGALISGWIFGNKIENLPLTFYIGAITSLMGFVYLTFIYKPENSME